MVKKKKKKKKDITVMVYGLQVVVGVLMMVTMTTPLNMPSPVVVHVGSVITKLIRQVLLSHNVFNVDGQ